MSWCPTPDCGFVFVFDGEKEFLCRKCKRHYCLTCKTQFHIGMSCDEYRISSSDLKEDKARLEYCKGKKMKQCPACQIWVERKQGCAHMRCVCGLHFCFDCGGHYGKCACKKRIFDE